jgi:hypothetical protein
VREKRPEHFQTNDFCSVNKDEADTGCDLGEPMFWREELVRQSKWDMVGISGLNWLYHSWFW